LLLTVIKNISDKRDVLFSKVIVWSIKYDYRHECWFKMR